MFHYQPILLVHTKSTRCRHGTLIRGSSPTQFPLKYEAFLQDKDQIHIYCQDVLQRPFQEDSSKMSRC